MISWISILECQSLLCILIEFKRKTQFSYQFKIKHFSSIIFHSFKIPRIMAKGRKKKIDEKRITANVKSLNWNGFFHLLSFEWTMDGRMVQWMDECIWLVVFAEQYYATMQISTAIKSFQCVTTTIQQVNPWLLCSTRLPIQFDRKDSIFSTIKADK